MNEICGLVQVLEQRFTRLEAERDALGAALEAMEDKRFQAAVQKHTPVQISLPSRSNSLMISEVYA